MNFNKALDVVPFWILARPHARHVTMTDNQLSYSEAFWAKIRTGLDQDDSNAKDQIIELLDIRGKIAFEN